MPGKPYLELWRALTAFWLLSSSGLSFPYPAKARKLIRKGAKRQVDDWWWMGDKNVQPVLGLLALAGGWGWLGKCD